MKRISNFFAVTALLVSGITYADFVTVERAYEIPLNLLRMPASVAGSVAFKECDHCDLRVVPVGPGTRYRLNNEDIELAEFRQELARVNDRQHTFIIVQHHLESDTITKISAHF